MFISEANNIIAALDKTLADRLTNEITATEIYSLVLSVILIEVLIQCVVV